METHVTLWRTTPEGKTAVGTVEHRDGRLVGTGVGERIVEGIKAGEYAIGKQVLSAERPEEALTALPRVFRNAYLFAGDPE